MREHNKPNISMTKGLIVIMLSAAALLSMCGCEQVHVEEPTIPMKHFIDSIPTTEAEKIDTVPTISISDVIDGALDENIGEENRHDSQPTESVPNETIPPESTEEVASNPTETLATEVTTPTEPIPEETAPDNSHDQEVVCRGNIDLLIIDEHGTELSGANVLITGNNYSQTFVVGKRGMVRLKQLECGNYDVIVLLSPYKVEKLSITIDELNRQRSIVLTEVLFEETDEMVFAKTSVNVRTGPGQEYDKVSMLTESEQVKRTGIGENGWSRIEQNGKILYVISECLERVIAPEETIPPETVPSEDESQTTIPTLPTEDNEDTTPTEPNDEINPSVPTNPSIEEPIPDIEYKVVDELVYATSVINIRSGPGTEYEIVGQLQIGEQIHRVGVGDNGWSVVIYNDMEAYATSKYLTTDKPDVQSDVLFIGNSLTVGLDQSTNKHSFIAETGATIRGMRVGGRYSEIANCNFGTVVIGFGTNELGTYTKEMWEKELSLLIKAIKEVNSNAKIVVMTVPPVSKNQDLKGNQFNNENVKICNQHLKEIAYSNGLQILDNSKFFGDVLAYDWTPDGIHLYGTLYSKWYDFIMSSI